MTHRVLRIGTGSSPARTLSMTGARALPLLAAGLLLAGCAGWFPVRTTVATPGMPNAEEALRQSLAHVDAEMAELGRLSPIAGRFSQPVLPADLQRIVSFDWNGPFDPAVAQLAASIGYTFFVSGPPNQQPLTVTIRIASVPVYRVFQVLGAEAGTRATVEVDPLHHQVQVIHHV